MSLFNLQENRIKCGKCFTDFDLNKNKGGCPLCGFGGNFVREDATLNFIKNETKTSINDEFLNIPPSLNLKIGSIERDDETEIWGSWLMFNDFFAPKFLARVLAWKLKKENRDYINLDLLMKESISIIEKQRLSSLKGFPNLKKDREGGRLVNHFLRTSVKMGLFGVKSIEKGVKEVWKEKWDKIAITLTKEGLEFAQLRNLIFDENKKEQVLSPKEKEWLIIYLKKIDKLGYKEYSVLKDVYEFLKKGNNGNEDLWKWFENNKRFQDYIFKRSKRARDDKKIFQKQLSNYAKTFASAKISLLRELGIIRNKRNDYAIMGEL